MSKSKETLTEGVLDYLSNILKKTSNARFASSLKSIENSGIEGKKAVAAFKKQAAELENSVEVVNKLNQKYRLTDFE